MEEKVLTTEEKITKLEKTKEDILSLRLELIANTRMDCDSAIANATASRIFIAERKIVLIDQNIEILKEELNKKLEIGDETND